MTLNNIESASRWYLQHFCQNGRIVKTIRGAWGPICSVIESQDRNAWDFVMLKNSWFYAFSKIYQVKERGIGQSFNINIIREAVRAKGRLVCIMPDYTTYSVLATDVENYITDNNTMRTPSTETGQEGSIPARMLKRLE